MNIFNNFAIFPLTITVIISRMKCETTSCTFGAYNFAAIGSREWLVISDKKNATFKLSVCGDGSSTSSCPKDMTLCSIKNDPSDTPVPPFTNDKVTKELWVNQKCSTGQKTDVYSIRIKFKCGMHLGSPEFIESSECVHYFEWYTYLACVDVDKGSEVVCSVHDPQNNKYDLTELIRVRGNGYQVDAVGERQMYINVCRRMALSKTDMAACDGSGGCMVQGGKHIKLGTPGEKLKLTSDARLELLYTGGDKQDGCMSESSTRIIFVCPKRGRSHGPMLVSDNDCQYVIEWRTEHACPVSYLTSHSCQLNSEDHDVDIDLSPLSLPPASDQMYSVSVTDRPHPSDHYTYYINVCQDVGMECPDSQHKKGVSGCQVKNGTTQAWSIGQTTSQLLRYADGELTLLYRGGAPCHTNFHRTTVINFVCDKSAGKGKPVFDSHFNCTYLFTWKTSHACLDHPSDNCQVTDGKRRFDLSPLVKTSGNNWKAIKADTSDDTQYYINICHDLVTSADTTGCPKDSSLCHKSGASGSSLGKFTTPPVYIKLTNQIQINYTTDEPCEGSRHHHSLINFICKTGDLESSPVYVRQTGCMHEFEWQTAAACVLSHSTGSGCRVFDKEAAYMLDLGRLTRPSHEPYKVSDAKGGYDYFINVCAPITGTKCNDDDKIGACQVKASDSSSHFNAGQFNTNLTYYNGMINLTYHNGAPYHTKTSQPIQRRTEIVFFCDQSAGVGHPQFVAERDYAYLFTWYTKYACLEPAVACTVTDDKSHEEYDLTSLTNHDGHSNWATLEHNSKGEAVKKFYINVCRAVTAGVPCARNAGVCVTSITSDKKTMSFTNLGQAISGPTVESSGRLLLEYTNGATCQDSKGKSRNITTKIHLVCNKAPLASSPMLETSSACEYSFLWDTWAACPLSHTLQPTNTSSCQLRDPVNDYIYDFNSLSRTGNGVYEVKGGGRTFKLDICSPIPEDICPRVAGSTKLSSVCEVTGGKKIGQGEVSYEVKVTDVGHMYLEYEGPRDGMKRSKVKVTFVCERNSSLFNLTYDSFTDQTFHFKFHTPLACAPKLVDCTVQDSVGRQYDLSPLGQQTSWSLEDHKVGDVPATYRLSVCRSLDLTSHPLCSGGSGACATTAGGDLNLGYILTPPVVSDAGLVSLQYLNGAPCPGAKGQHSRTTINFDCIFNKEFGPVFVEKTQSCEYVFLWSTPAACPIYRNVGSDCKVKDNLYGIEFDLSPLSLKGKHYTVKGDDAMYLLNVCSPLDNGKGECGGGKVGACEVKLKGDSTQSIGNFNTSLIYERGEITTTLNKGHSDSGHICQTKIVFTCDHSVSGNDGPKLISRTVDCVYLFQWPTRLACPPNREVDCKIRNKAGEEYDLSGLILPGSNYEVVTSTPANQKYIVNICRTLVHRKDQTCPVNAAACRVNMTETDPHKRFHNIGELGSSMLSFSNDRVLVTYKNGEVCPNGQRSSTVVHLRCDKLAIDTQPGNEYAVDNCTYHIMWDTRAACPLSSVATNVGSCKAKNYATGYVFDLSSLKPHTFNLTDRHLHIYYVRACEPLTTDHCKDVPKSGMCQQEQNGEHREFSGGAANDKLEYTNHALFLKYTGGTAYNDDNKTPRETLVNFVCRKNGGQGAPLLIREDEKTYHFLWHTELACEKQVRCAVDNGSQIIDLSPLIKPSGHHLAIPAFWGNDDKGATYYINVCRPLNPIQGVLCPPGASSCRVLQGDRPRDLGKSNKPPYIDKDSGKVTLEYDHGGPCVHTKDVNTRTRIVFSCLPGPHVGIPKLEQATADCVYVFKWETNVVCPTNKPQPTNECKYRDTKTNQVFDLSGLTKSGSYYKVPWGSDVHYQINVCGPVSHDNDGCHGAAVCQVTGSKKVAFGLARKAEFMRQGDMLSLTYSHGEKCRRTNGLHQTTIYFKCNRDKVGDIKTGYAEDCTTTFYWSVPQVCGLETRPCVFSDGASVYDLSALTRDSGAWNVTDDNKNRYWLNICEGVSKGPTGCHEDDTVCRLIDGSSTTDSLGKLMSQSFKSVERGKSFSLTYTSPSSCDPSLRTRSLTQITFTCANTIGAPTFVSSDGQCNFKFVWRTRIACSTYRVMAMDHDGVIRDDQSGATFNLAHLMSQINGNLVVEAGSFRYIISLRGHLTLNSRVGASCRGAVICEQKTNDASHHRSLAEYNSRKYYVQDNELQVEYESPTPCGDSKVESIIRFTCTRGHQPINPVTLDYISKNMCAYVFEWKTGTVCNALSTEASVDKHLKDNKNMTGHVSPPHTSNNTTLIVVLTLMFLAFGVFLGVLFRKKEKRQWLHFKLRMFFCRYKETKMSYTALATTNDASPSLPLNPFHDDSDEDLLL